MIDTIALRISNDPFWIQLFQVWKLTCPRLEDFLTTYESKIKSKIKGTYNKGGELDEMKQKDLAVELSVAWLLLKGPSDWNLTYEPSKKNMAGPDYKISSQAGKWQIEVKHIHEDDTCKEIDFEQDHPDDWIKIIPTRELIDKLACKILEKLHQCSSTVPTLILVDTQHCWIGPDYLGSSIGRIKSGIAQDEEWIINCTKFKTMDQVRAGLHNSGGIAILSTWPTSQGNRFGICINSNAPTSFPVEALTFLRTLEVYDRVF